MFLLPRTKQLLSANTSTGNRFFVFPYLPINQTQIKRTKNKKEQEMFVRKMISAGEAFKEEKRQKLPGSLTVEAALVFPFFLGTLALFFTFFFGQLLGLRLQKALDEVCEDAAVWSYALDFAEQYTGTDLMSLADGSMLTGALSGDGEDLSALLSGETDLMWEIRQFLIEQASALLWQQYLRYLVTVRVGREKLDAFVFLENGAGGISLAGSTLKDRELDLVLSYRIKAPLPFPFSLKYQVVQRSCRRLWTGTARIPDPEQPQDPAQETEEQTVYVTPCGSVYHLTAECRILDIRPLPGAVQGMSVLRNKYGAKYYPCERCMLHSGMTEGTVYYTEDGNRYHRLRDCPSLKRGLIELAIGEAKTKYRRCHYCGGS